jgi:hypothetical protein
MATPHPALDAAVQQFAHQPGVTPADVAALQAAIGSDPNLTQRLDHAATTGALKGFASAGPSAPDAPIGTYDPAAGTVTLPSSSFASSGAPPSGDLHAVLRVQAMVVEFGGKNYPDGTGATHAVTPDMVSNLQDTLNRSPALAHDIQRAANTADPMQPSHCILESFAFTAPGPSVGSPLLSSLSAKAARYCSEQRKVESTFVSHPASSRRLPLIDAACWHNT